MRCVVRGLTRSLVLSCCRAVVLFFSFLFVRPCQTAFAYHNLLMSVLSLVMFCGAGWAFLDRLVVDEGGSLQFAFCEGDGSAHTGQGQGQGARGRYYFWSYIYYLSKFYELLDTVFLALKGKLVGWGGLNVWHHALVVFMAWQWSRCIAMAHSISSSRAARQ